eukprot:4025577-Ditylum_brightwellii.AAC.1
MERANTRSFEAVRETEQPTHEEINEGDHAELGCKLFLLWFFSSCASKLDVPCLLTPCHAAAL